MIKVMHTSDWHLGKNIKDIRREGEYKSVLDQVYSHIECEQPSVLLISGDIFDTTLPPIWAQKLYYQFLMRLKELPHHMHIVITAGNHDSAAWLEAPKEMLKHYYIDIVGGANIQEENPILLIDDEDGELTAIVIAVPYLRDAQMRTIDVSSPIDNWQQHLHDAMREFYHKQIVKAISIRGERMIPIIVMGHLFLRGGSINDQDGTRPSVGTLGEFIADDLFDDVSYVALGHLHQPQCVSGKEHWRYSGSLLKSSFSEVHHQKSLVSITFVDREMSSYKLCSLVDPVEFIRLHGSWSEQELQLQNLIKTDRRAYVECNVTKEFLTVARQWQEDFAKASHGIFIIQITRTDKLAFSLSERLDQHAVVKLNELKPIDIFKKRLELDSLLDVQQTTILTELFLHIEKQCHEENIISVEEER
ncbi:exonuclease subunit SbcD [Entomospira nematocerorum]|nr:exonuclease subunit SbcD [Entomospira nematocera]WDI34525.1 exonuclease subunit SbcD [Entomospira nematocera]